MIENSDTPYAYLDIFKMIKIGHILLFYIYYNSLLLFVIITILFHIQNTQVLHEVYYKVKTIQKAYLSLDQS